jgi:hypothetical protein
MTPSLMAVHVEWGLDSVTDCGLFKIDRVFHMPGSWTGQWQDAQYSVYACGDAFLPLWLFKIAWSVRADD